MSKLEIAARNPGARRLPPRAAGNAMKQHLVIGHVIHFTDFPAAYAARNSWRSSCKRPEGTTDGLPAANLRVSILPVSLLW